MKQPTALPAASLDRRPWRKRLLFALAAIAVLLIGSFVVYGYRYRSALQELADVLAEADRLDPGWRFEDLEAQRQLPPDEQNAALQVLTVYSVFPQPWPSRFKDDVLAVPPERQLNERQMQCLRADLLQAALALTEARRLADLPEGRYPVTWTAGPLSTPCPWLDALMRARWLLQLDVLLQNQDGNPDAALRSARALLNVGRSPGDEPFLGGPAYRNGGRYEAAWAVERTLAQGQPSESALAALQEAIGREDVVPLLLAHFRGKRAVMHVFFTRVNEGEYRLSQLEHRPTRGVAARIETWGGRVNALHVHARFLRGMTEAVEIAKLPLDQQYPRFQEWRRQWEYLDKTGDDFKIESRAEDGFLAAHARLRCTLAALAAERYRRQHGAWPQALVDLVPDYLWEIPLDPFDGQPIRYRRTDCGAVIYSIGKDGRDDGGDPSRPPGEWCGSLDEVFTLWDVAHRRQPPQPPAPPVVEPGTGRD